MVSYAIITDAETEGRTWPFPSVYPSHAMEEEEISSFCSYSERHTQHTEKGRIERRKEPDPSRCHLAAE